VVLSQLQLQSLLVKEVYGDRRFWCLNYFVMGSLVKTT